MTKKLENEKEEKRQKENKEKKEKANKKCTAEFHNSLLKYKRREIKVRFITRMSR